MLISLIIPSPRSADSNDCSHNCNYAEQQDYIHDDAFGGITDSDLSVIDFPDTIDGKKNHSENCDSEVHQGALGRLLFARRGLSAESPVVIR